LPLTSCGDLLFRGTPRSARRAKAAVRLSPTTFGTVTPPATPLRPPALVARVDGRAAGARVVAGARVAGARFAGGRATGACAVVAPARVDGADHEPVVGVVLLVVAVAAVQGAAAVTVIGVGIVVVAVTVTGAAPLPEPEQPATKRATTSSAVGRARSAGRAGRRRVLRPAPVSVPSWVRIDVHLLGPQVPAPLDRP
jgi:hypothetical protein